MRLSRLFLLTTGLLLGLVTLMLLRATLTDWRTVLAAEQGLQAMERAYLAMKVAEKASAERGPSNVVLGEAQPPDPVKRARLVEFRSASDLAFDTALSALKGQTDGSSKAAQDVLTQARTQLLRGRAEVDRVAALPPAERITAAANQTRAAVDQMFAVIDTVLVAVTHLSASAEALYPELAGPLVGARYAAELREYAGRLGSQFAAPLANQTPLGPREALEIPELVGRIEQLRKLIQLHANATGIGPELRLAIETMQSRYFGEDLPFIQRLTAAGLAGQPYGIDSAGFVARYVPPMKSIVELRDSLFLAARDAAGQRRAATEHRLWINLSLGGAILAIELAVFLLIRRRVLVPVLRNTRAMVDIMQGRVAPSDQLAPSQRQDEIGDMERAVRALRDATLRSRALEAELGSTVEQLKLASATDFLTGLPNRRAFAERATALIGQARRHDWTVALLIFDLDHFKQINDRFGHPCGDRVLTLVAEVARREVREADLLARHGGEEFVLLAPDCSEAAAHLLAERLRAAVAAAVLSSDEGQAVPMTASFGVCCQRARDLAHLDDLIRRADRALYAAKAQGRNRVEFATEQPAPDISQ